MEQAYLPGTVRQRIQELIKERKITQAELAAEIGMAESSLSRFLSEKLFSIYPTTQECDIIVGQKGVETDEKKLSK